MNANITVREIKVNPSKNRIEEIELLDGRSFKRCPDPSIVKTDATHVTIKYIPGFVTLYCDEAVTQWIEAEEDYDITLSAGDKYYVMVVQEGYISSDIVTVD